MKIAVCTRQNHIELEQRPVPEIDEEKVLVRVKLCGICGSDIAAWRGSGHKKYPYTPGHEFCGIIEKTGGKVGRLAVGQQVIVDPNLGCGECEFCEMGRPNLCDFLKSRPIKSNGAFAEYVALDYRMIYLQPYGLDDQAATFVEPVSCAMHAFNTARARPDERVVIFGAGMMGFLTTLVFQSFGFDPIVVDPVARRRERVSGLLSVHALSPAGLEASNMLGRCEVAVDCSGKAAAVAQAILALRKTGRLILAGLVMDLEGAGISLIDVATKELCIQGVWLNPHSFSQAIELVLQRQDVLARLEREVFTLDRVAEAFERASSPDNAPKVMVSC